jgi:integrase
MLYQTSTGRYYVVFRDGDRYRSLSIGRVAAETATRIYERLRALIEAKQYGVLPDEEVLAWARKLSPHIRARLERAGLLNGNRHNGPTLAHVLNEYFAKRTDLAIRTQDLLMYTMQRLEQFFGAARPIASITQGDAYDWTIWLKTQGRRRGAGMLADNTVRKMVAFASQIFLDAVRHNIIPNNPFAGLPRQVRPIPEKDRFVTREEIDRLMSVLPDAELRLIVALARYGGLRVPSELLALRWSDVNWERRRMVIHAPKTKRAGTGIRVIPIFPELAPYLEAAWDNAPEGAEFVIAQHRYVSSKLRCVMHRYLKLAGLQPWPKLFITMRQSRAIELAREYPAHVATAWLGHSAQVAMRHYWRVTEADFERAVQPAVHNTLSSCNGQHDAHGVGDNNPPKDNVTDLKPAT